MDDVTEAAPIPPERGGDQAEELAYRLRQQQLITEFGCFAFKEHDMDVMLQEASRVSAQGLQSEFSKVLEYLPHEKQFLVRSGVGWKPGVVGHARVPGDTNSPAGYAFMTAEPVISNHVSDDDRFRTPPLLVEHGVKRAINVIIRSGDNCYGILEVDSSDGGRFTEADADFLQGFANLLGVALERRQAELSLRRSLDDQQMLTQEISHRVKNSLSIVASLLAMQRRLSDSSEVQAALLDAEARVQTVAQVHDRLWRSNEVRSIDLADFMNELCVFLGTAGPKHVLLCDVPHLSIATDRAVPLGLLANELVTNAFKYAFPPDESGEVRLSIEQIDSDRLRFEVSDGGIGLPADGTAKTSKSLGMRLIENLARQLDGRTAWEDNKPGVRFVMTFPQ